jgi:hypothetical protein
VADFVTAQNKSNIDQSLNNLVKIIKGLHYPNSQLNLGYIL